MTGNKRLVSVMTPIFIFVGIALTDPSFVYGQAKGDMVRSQGSARDPFLLPPGVHLLATKGAAPGAPGVSLKSNGKPDDLPSSPLSVKAILISDHVRLALIDRHIVTIGDSIRDERVLEIRNDGVILEKKDKKRTLLLSQSPVQLTVEEKKGVKK
jgi:hypothetical protein